MSQKLSVSLIAPLTLFAAFTGDVHAQFSDARIVSQHIRIRVPQEREWLARESVPDLERCWQFVHRLLGEKLPRWLVVTLDWRTAVVNSDPDQGTVSIGMLNRAAEPDPKRYIMHRAAREIARLGLLELCRGGSALAESGFLLDGMSEIVAHEFDHTTRTLGGAWVLARLMDRIQPITLRPAPQPARDPGTLHDLRASAVGVTFLMACQEMFGREKVLRLFAALRKASLEESIKSTFKTPARTVEENWLRKVRQYPLSDATVTSEDEAPTLQQIALAPETTAREGMVQVSLLISDRTGDTPVDGIFVVDGARVLEAQAAPLGRARVVTVDLPIGKVSVPGPREIQVVAVDEAGNVRVWPRTLPVR
jgi:hypothetical protein